MKNIDQVKPFQIRFVKEVSFKDCNGTVLKTYGVGDVVTATCMVGDGGYGSYYVTGMGGIYTDEAEKVALDITLPV